MKKWIALALILTLNLPALAHTGPQPPASLDPLAQGLWWLYHLQYDHATSVFDEYITHHPEDPAGYFYKAATAWWHLAQEFEYPHPDVAKQLDDQVDLTVAKAQDRLAKLDEDNPAQAHEAALAYLYWGGAEGLRGRWLVTQKRWIKAYFSGRTGANMLRKALKVDPHLDDAYMGLGIYDYFSDTLSGFMAALSAVFVRGDRHRGIEELKRARAHGHQARVEATVFLAEIYTFEEDQPTEALALIKELRSEFPHSPLMHLMEVTALFQAKRWPEVKTEAQEFLERSEQTIPWYSAREIPPALYCLGVAELWGEHNADKALAYFERILNEAKPDDPSRWVSFAHLRRGQIYDIKGERAKALMEYRIVLSRDDIWGSQKEARLYVRTPFQG